MIIELKAACKKCGKVIHLKREFFECPKCGHGVFYITSLRLLIEPPYEIKLKGLRKRVFGEDNGKR